MHLSTINFSSKTFLSFRTPNIGINEKFCYFVCIHSVCFSRKYCIPKKRNKNSILSFQANFFINNSPKFLLFFFILLLLLSTFFTINEIYNFWEIFFFFILISITQAQRREKKSIHFQLTSFQRKNKYFIQQY